MTRSALEKAGIISRTDRIAERAKNRKALHPQVRRQLHYTLKKGSIGSYN